MLKIEVKESFSKAAREKSHFPDRGGKKRIKTDFIKFEKENNKYANFQPRILYTAKMYLTVRR